MKEDSEVRRKMMMNFILSLIAESEGKPKSLDYTKEDNVIHLPVEEKQPTDTRFKALREKLANKEKNPEPVQPVSEEQG